MNDVSNTLNVQEVPDEEKDAEKNKSNEEENVIKCVENTLNSPAKKCKRKRKLLKVVHIV